MADLKEKIEELETKLDELTQAITDEKEETKTLLTELEQTIRELVAAGGSQADPAILDKSIARIVELIPQVRTINERPVPPVE